MHRELALNRFIAALAIALAVSLPALGDASISAERVTVGNKPVSGHTLNDGFVVSRSMIKGSDAHGFSDLTVMDKIKDAGTYGAFDSVVQLFGSNRHNHIYSFQDRVRYAGSGVLENTGGFISRPVHSGTGKILMRTAVDLGDVEVKGAGSVEQNVGIYIRNLAAGNMNTAIVMAQSSGYGIYSSGVAPSYHRSDLLFGTGSGPVLLDDPRKSEAPRDLSQAEHAVAKQLKGMIKASRNKDSGKTHVGIQAAEIQAAFKANGLDVEQYAILERTPQGLGVRYEELLAFVVSAI